MVYDLLKEPIENRLKIMSISNHDNSDTQPVNRPSQTDYIHWAWDHYQRRLFTPEQIDAGKDEHLSEAEYAQLKSALNWIQNFIMKPHPNLGRPGAVCPYVQPSMDDGLFYFTIAQPTNPDNFDTIFQELSHYKEIFLPMTPTSGPLSELRAFIILFPDSPEQVLANPKDSKAMKTRLMEEGVTVGQFFPTTDVKKQLKSKFFPIQPPLPLYSMRTFIESDWEFIKREPEWREVYHQKFGKPK